MLGILDDGIMILISGAYSVCDIICILFFCPFQTWFMKNKCCSACRIYNWDYAMMFTPLFFVKRFYAWSLLVLSFALLVRWEITFYRHPERFSENTNDYLQCKNCTEKLCAHKKQLHTLWKQVEVFTAERIRALKSEREVSRREAGSLSDRRSGHRAVLIAVPNIEHFHIPFQIFVEGHKSVSGLSAWVHNCRFAENAVIGPRDDLCAEQSDRAVTDADEFLECLVAELFDLVRDFGRLSLRPAAGQIRNIGRKTGVDDICDLRVAFEILINRYEHICLNRFGIDS